MPETLFPRTSILRIFRTRRPRDPQHGVRLYRSESRTSSLKTCIRPRPWYFPLSEAIVCSGELRNVCHAVRLTISSKGDERFGQHQSRLGNYDQCYLKLCDSRASIPVWPAGIRKMVICTCSKDQNHLDSWCCLKRSLPSMAGTSL